MIPNLPPLGLFGDMSEGLSVQVRCRREQQMASRFGRELAIK